MLIEKIVFTILAIYLLIMTFFKFIKKMDKVYISILIVELLGLILGILEVVFDFNFNIFMKIIKYLFSVALPIAIILIERKGKNFSEYIYMLLAKFYDFTRK